MDVDPAKTAVVLIEFQNDFTNDGGALHEAVKGVMDDSGMLANSRRMADEARKAGATVIHAPITFAPGYGELGNHDKVYGILKGVIDSTAFVKGTWGAEICDQMKPAESDTELRYIGLRRYFAAVRLGRPPWMSTRQRPPSS